MLNKMKKTRAGFTLVELIVVIAILAILAGVAIPVYSSYIKKANKTADLQLLDAVNSAFAAACLENNVASSKLPDGAATIVLTGKYITGVTVTAAGITAASIRATGTEGGFAMLGAHTAQLAATSTLINDSFEKYFKGNETQELKYFYLDDNAPTLVFEGGAFKSSEDADSQQYSFFGSTVTVNQSDINNLKNSVFGQMGATQLTGNVAKVTGIASDLLATGHGTSYMSDAGFVSFMSSILPEGTTIDDLSADQKANALVLYAANQSAGKTGADYVTAFTTNQEQTAMNLLSNNPAYLADAAAAYATMMAFANSEYGDKYEIGGQSVKDYFTAQTSSLAHMSDIVALLQTLNTATLKSGETSDIEVDGKTAMYAYTETKAATQLDGYLSALNMVDSNLSNITSDNIVTLLGSGYNSSEIVALLDQVLSGSGD